MVLDRSESVDSTTTSSSRHLRESSALTASEVPQTSSSAGDGGSSVSAVAGSLLSSTLGASTSVTTGSTPIDGPDVSQSGESDRHLAHRWMRADVAAAIRNIHNTKKATIKQHYYPEFLSSWGWVIVLTTSLALSIGHGVQLAVCSLLPSQIVPPGSSGSRSSVIGNGQQHSVNWTSFPLTSRGALAALSLCVTSLLSPVIVAWCRRKSTRLTAVFGGLLAALGLLFTSFASQFNQLFLSYGVILGTGVGLTRDTATLMVGQYFKRRREAVEIALVGASGIGLAIMTVFLHTTIGIVGWRLGLQAVTGVVLLTFILGSCYRSASLYHPQRRAILHLKNQRKKIKEKNKHEDKPPFFDFSSLKSRTIQTIMLSTAFIAAGFYTPLIYLGFEAEKTMGRDSSMMLQIYLGLAWSLGCVTMGLLIVYEPAECRIGRQYLCQVTALAVGLTLLFYAVVMTPSHFHVTSGSTQTASPSASHGHHGFFCWVYGFGLGAYHYSLKMFVYQRVRARNFARAWSFVQASQALPILCGISFTGFLSVEYGQKVAYYTSSAFVISGSLALFIIDLRKYVLSRSHSHKHSHHHRKPRPADRLASRLTQTDDPSAGKESVEASAVGNQSQPLQEEIEENDICPPSCKGRLRRDSLAEEEVHLPPLTLLQQTSLVLAQLGELPCGAAAAELTCISEEGIADMDIPDHLLEELDFAADCITSCDKVENYLMLSEYENNLIQQSATSTSERKTRKSSFFKQWGLTLNGRYGHHRNGCPAESHSPANSAVFAQQGSRRISHAPQRVESSLNMIQIHEGSESEAKV